MNNQLALKLLQRGFYGGIMIFVKYRIFGGGYAKQKGNCYNA